MKPVASPCGQILPDRNLRFDDATAYVDGTVYKPADLEFCQDRLSEKRPDNGDPDFRCFAIQ